MVAHVVILCLALGPVLPAAGEGSASVSGDLKKLQGTWEAKAGPGKDQPLRMTIKDDALTLRYSVPGGKQPLVLQGRIKLNEATTPRAMDWLDMHSGANALPPVYSIYELKDDTLRVRGSGAKERPTEFQDGDNVPRHRSLSFRRVPDKAS